MWRYLENAYNTEGMHQSTPADREIIRHYEGKTSSRKKQTHASLMKDARTFSVPSAAAQQQQQQHSNGGAAGDRHSSGSEPEQSLTNDYQRQPSEEAPAQPADNGDVIAGSDDEGSAKHDGGDVIAGSDGEGSTKRDSGDVTALGVHSDGEDSSVAEKAKAVVTEADETPQSDPIHNGD